MKLIPLGTLAVSLLYAAATHAEGTRKEAYTPGMGDIMGATQMRHAKLWFAGSARNWELAQYELGELREGLDDAIAYHPVFKGAPVSGILDQYMSAPLANLAKAVQAKDITKFRSSFDSLTAACNSCHAAAEHGYIVIKRPNTPPFGNQEFLAHPN